MIFFSIIRNEIKIIPNKLFNFFKFFYLLSIFSVLFIFFIFCNNFIYVTEEFYIAIALYNFIFFIFYNLYIKISELLNSSINIMVLNFFSLYLTFIIQLKNILYIIFIKFLLFIYMIKSLKKKIEVLLKQWKFFNKKVHGYRYFLHLLTIISLFYKCIYYKFLYLKIFLVKLFNYYRYIYYNYLNNLFQNIIYNYILYIYNIIYMEKFFNDINGLNLIVRIFFPIIDNDKKKGNNILETKMFLSNIRNYCFFGEKDFVINNKNNEFFLNNNLDQLNSNVNSNKNEEIINLLMYKNVKITTEKNL